MVTMQDIESLSNHISGSIADISIESMSDINITVMHNDYDIDYAKLLRISVSSYFIGNNTIGRDEYEDQLLLFFSRVWAFARANGTEDEIELKPVLLGEELKMFEQFVNEDVQEVIELTQSSGETAHENENQESYTDWSLYSDTIIGWTTPPLTTFPWLTLPPTTSSIPSTSTPASKPSLGKVIYTQNQATSNHRIAQWMLKDEFIDVTHSLVCPHVPVNISNTTTIEKIPNMGFLFMGETVRVSSEQKVAVINGQMQLCTSLYRKLTGPILTRNKQSLLEQVQYYIEVICVSLSVICLLLSSVTYCVFPSLRSLPGMNNLSLCMSLAVAQTCLLITARWGVNKLFPQVYCLMHAVLLHYSWLAAFAWMSVCCIHMFRVFTANSNKFTDNRSDKKRYLHYCFYGFGVPALIVIATYATNATVSSGMSSGYNNDICFLDTRRSIWTLVLSLLAPLCLVIITNSFMFVMTVRQIVHVSNLQENSRSRDRQGVLTYVKLSTLTGLLGAVVVVAVQLNSPVLSLLTSPLMALQGVFIFVSFTCNQRVRRLYVDLFGRLGLPCVKSTERTTSTGSTALRTSSNKPSKGQTLSTTI